MASFNCDQCGALLVDTGLGFATGCEHNPSNNVPVVACECGNLYALHTVQGRAIKNGGECDNCVRIHAKNEA